MFPIIDIGSTFLKTPTTGSAPSISLNEMFEYFKNKSFSRPFGINPDKLFRETSKSSRPFKLAMDEGMIPSKEFPCKQRLSKFNKFPIVVGISLDKLFSKTSRELIFFKLPTSIGNLPPNELQDKFSNSDKEKEKKPTKV